jgi:ABC-type branched-subunit amino acid transport system permease subunit
MKKQLMNLLGHLLFIALGGFCVAGISASPKTPILEAWCMGVCAMVALYVIVGSVRLAGYLVDYNRDEKSKH